jgi:hypothetical protein
MCNLYSITTNQAAIVRLFRVLNRYVGNLQPMPGVFPDYPAPVVRNAGSVREMVLMRWGMPPPPRAGGFPVTNIRNTTSPHWRGWLKPENRCLVPFNSFAEYPPEREKPKRPTVRANEKTRCSMETFAARDGVQDTIHRQSLRRSCRLAIDDIHHSRLESRSEHHDGPHRSRRCCRQSARTRRSIP